MRFDPCSKSHQFKNIGTQKCIPSTLQYRSTHRRLFALCTANLLYSSYFIPLLWHLCLLREDKCVRWVFTYYCRSCATVGNQTCADRYLFPGSNTRKISFVFRREICLLSGNYSLYIYIIGC